MDHWNDDQWPCESLLSEVTNRRKEFDLIPISYLPRQEVIATHKITSCRHNLTWMVWQCYSLCIPGESMINTMINAFFIDIWKVSCFITRLIHTQSYLKKKPFFYFTFITERAYHTEMCNTVLEGDMNSNWNRAYWTFLDINQMIISNVAMALTS